MAIRLRNSWQYVGDDRWDWEIFVDDDGSGELSKISHVDYVLHDTFQDPIRQVRSAKDGFRLKTNGWGTFTVRAFVHFKDGRKKRLSHELVLKSSSGVTS